MWDASRKAIDTLTALDPACLGGREENKEETNIY